MDLTVGQVRPLSSHQCPRIERRWHLRLQMSLPFQARAAFLPYPHLANAASAGVSPPFRRAACALTPTCPRALWRHSPRPAVCVCDPQAHLHPRGQGHLHLRLQHAAAHRRPHEHSLRATPRRGWLHVSSGSPPAGETIRRPPLGGRLLASPCLHALASAAAVDPTPPHPFRRYMMYSGENTFGSVSAALEAGGAITDAELAEARAAVP